MQRFLDYFTDYNIQGHAQKTQCFLMHGVKSATLELQFGNFSDAASGWAGWALGVQLTLLQPGGQIMPTTLLLAHPDLKTQRQLCILYLCYQLKK